MQATVYLPILTIVVVMVSVWILYTTSSVRQIVKNKKAPQYKHDEGLLDKRKIQCSYEAIRDYIRTHDFFPQEGTWIMSNNTPVDLTPTMCYFQNEIMSENLIQCIKKKQFYSFLILGDSNGMKYAQALIHLLSQRHKTTVKTIRQERTRSFTPDIQYFKKGSRIEGESFRIHDRDCSGCKSFLKECRMEGIIIRVEYIAMEFTLDTEVTTRVNFKPQGPPECLPGRQCFQSTTYQEMIFREYLTDQYPDVLMIFQNSHDRMRKPLAVFDAEMQYFVKLLENLVPENSTVVWLSEMDEYVPKKHKFWANLTIEGGYSNSEHIRKINQIMFETCVTKAK